MRTLRLANNTVPTSSNPLTNSTTKTAFADGFSWPANTLSAAGAGVLFHLKGFGYVSSAGSSPGTLALSVDLGSTALGTGTITLPTSLSSAGFVVDAFVLLATMGTSGKAACQGMVTLDNAGTPVTAAILNTGTGTSGQVTVNTQTAAVLTLSGKFSVASTSNILTWTQLLIMEER